MEKLVRVQILGREYIIKSDEEEERVGKIAEYVNQRIKELAEGTKTISTLNVVILAALNIANDYFKALESQRKFTQTIEAKSGRLIEMINAQID